METDRKYPFLSRIKRMKHKKYVTWLHVPYAL